MGIEKNKIEEKKMYATREDIFKMCADIIDYSNETKTSWWIGDYYEGSDFIITQGHYFGYDIKYKGKKVFSSDTFTTHNKDWVKKLKKLYHSLR
jgi:hypothetical protein